MSKHCADCANRIEKCQGCSANCLIECASAKLDIAEICNKFEPKKDEAENGKKV